MKKLLLLVSVAAFALPGAANAAVTLTGATVTGSINNTVWTTGNTSNYALFLQTPGLGDFLNPNREAISYTLSSASRFLLAGEGYFPAPATADSDPLYNISATFSDGHMLTGSYSPVTNTFLGGTSFVAADGNTYSLAEFSYRRYLGDAVNQNTAVPGGDGNDYAGNFRIASAVAAVPEPATWGLMILGFGMVGATLRRGKTSARDTLNA